MMKWNRAAVVILSCMAVSGMFSAEAGADPGIKIFRNAANSVVVVTARDWRAKDGIQGSGVVVGANTVVTNCHNVTFTSPSGEVHDMEEIFVKQAERKKQPQRFFEMKAELDDDIGRQDLCFLHVEELSSQRAAKPVRFSSVNNLSIGEAVCALGSPMGLELSISCGVVSQFRSCQKEKIKVPCGEYPDRVIQIDADIAPGSSGGGLFNKNGELVGITTSRVFGSLAPPESAVIPGPSIALPADWIRTSRYYSRVLSRASRDMAKQSNFRKAREVAETIHHTDRRAKALVRLARRQARNGEPTGAINTADRAVRVAYNAYAKRERRYSHSHYISDLIRIAHVYEEAGSMQKAGRTIARALQAARAYSARDRFDSSTHARHLTRIGRTQSEIGDAAGARQTFSRALAAARRVVGPVSRASVLTKIACAQKKAGDAAGAAATKSAYRRAIRTADPGKKIDRIRRRMQRCEV